MDTVLFCNDRGCKYSDHLGRCTHEVVILKKSSDVSALICSMRKDVEEVKDER